MSINQLIANKKKIVSVKRIRKILHIEKDDKTNINFYWRCLKGLESEGILKKIGDGKYEILKSDYLLFSETEENTCKNCNASIGSYRENFVNIARSEIFYFCCLDCKKEWIFKQTREAKPENV